MSEGTANVSTGGAPTTFVLIPGAGTDPRVYGETIDALRELGHEGVAPPLPRGDADATPSDHAEAIVAALGDPPPAPLVVVGQSLGAYSATIAAARLRPRRLILLAPMIPAPGESAGDWWAGTDHPEAIAALTERLGPPSGWGEEALAEVFLHDVDEATRAASARYSGVPSDGLFAEPLPLESWPDVPTTVLAPRDDRLFPLEFQRRVARERLGLEVEEMAGGHLPFLSRPRELAERLVELA
ncbi:MAG TPA: alpha/beta hydrolase [Solirubrobacterales bacterium]|nr:alpha/beta hydrolase [Solirubrobacterales bacterium]